MSGNEVSEPLKWEDIPALLDELRDMAKRLLARWPGMHSLQPTLLVDTALRRQRVGDQAWDEVTWDTRSRFFGQVFRAMRHKLVEIRRSQNRPGCRIQRGLSIAEFEAYEEWRRWTEDPEVALALDLGLSRLAEHKPELAEVVHYRFFAGLTRAETAQILEVSVATVGRRWEQARLMLQEAILEGSDPVLPGGDA